ncbi:MAG: DEAD/DEAH box helicase family protein [Bacteroidales bacterium]|nr:DEAD/DEAH box helicase family protein [Bacteroidales bacterium]
MSQKSFIQVLLPLKLDWEPVYALPEGSQVRIGDRIEVEFARKTYPAIVTAVDVVPEPGIDVKTACWHKTPDQVVGDANNTSLPAATGNLLSFWRQLASYYLCTPGEVFKAASIPEKPIKRKPQKKVKQPVPVQLSLEQEAAYSSIISAFSKRKTVLLEAPPGSGKTELYLRLAAHALSRGKSVLYLVPDIGLTKQLEEKVAGAFPDVLAYHSGRTPLSRHRIALEVAGDEPRFVLGTKSAIFLPFRDLGLIIVDQEHDTSFKQESPAPRFNAREAAIMLAQCFGASVVLGSATPSLESLYNAETGLFAKVNLKENLNSAFPGIGIINTAAEIRKGGMSGEFSLKLLEEIKAALSSGLPVTVLRTQRYSPLIEDELSKLFPGAAIQVCGRRDIRTIDLSGPGLCVIMHADIFLTLPDFRSDEHALQLLRHLQGPEGNRRLVIQTHEPGHPVFKALRTGATALVFLAERRQFNLPPFTRLVDIIISDNNPKRLNYLSKLLASSLPGSLSPSLPGSLSPSLPVSTSPSLPAASIRIALPRDRSLKSRKEAVYTAVKAFEKDHKYTGHIVIDVDPA